MSLLVVLYAQLYNVTQRFALWGVKQSTNELILRMCALW